VTTYSGDFELTGADLLETWGSLDLVTAACARLMRGMKLSAYSASSGGTGEKTADTWQEALRQLSDPPLSISVEYKTPHSGFSFENTKLGASAYQTHSGVHVDFTVQNPDGHSEAEKLFGRTKERITPEALGHAPVQSDERPLPTETTPQLPIAPDAEVVAAPNDEREQAQLPVAPDTQIDAPPSDWHEQGDAPKRRLVVISKLLSWPLFWPTLFATIIGGVIVAVIVARLHLAQGGEPDRPRPPSGGQTTTSVTTTPITPALGTPHSHPGP
jgi:hypothetical protein